MDVEESEEEKANEEAANEEAANEEAAKPCPKRRKIEEYISKIEAATNREGRLSVSGIAIGQNAKEPNISRAKREISRVLHPDNVQDPDLKKRATAAMATVTLAHRLLLNPADDNGQMDRL